MAALWGGAAVVLADLTGTRICDASGLGMLVEIHREARAVGAELRVAASPPVRRIMGIARLDEVLAIYPTLCAARSAAPGQT
jgi:anti-anti-sigma factor